MPAGAPAVDYASIAATYDRSRQAEPAIVDALINGCKKIHASSVLDLGSGTGNYAQPLKRAGYEVTALDLSAEMLARSESKHIERKMVADAMSLPLVSASFDAIVGVNLLHHLPEIQSAMREMHRVAAKGVVLQAVARENLESLWYRAYFPEIDTVLLPLHPPLGLLITSLLRAGFVRVIATPICYSGCADKTFESARHKPELLFDEQFRASTSGFRRLEGDGIERGLKNIRADIDRGRLAPIIEQHEAAYLRSGDCFVLTAFASA